MANVKKKKYSNVIFKDFRIYYLIILLIFLLTFDYTKDWKYFNSFITFNSWSVYGDLRLLLKGIDLYGAGIDPFKQQYDPPYNYPSTWRIFSYIRLFTESNFKTIGFLLILISQTLLLHVSGKWNSIKKASYYIILLVSPVSLLIFERGNSDLFIFIFLLLPLVFFPKQDKLLSNFFLIISLIGCFMLKLYPFGAFIVMLYIYYPKIDFKRGIILSLMLIIVLIYISHYFRQIEWIKHRTPEPITILGFGFSTPIKNILHFFEELRDVKLTIWVSYFVLWMVGIFSFYKLNYIKIKNLDLTTIGRNKILLFLVGAGIFLFSFILTNSWEYRLFFLMLCIPALISWSKMNQLGAKYILIILIFIFWNQTIRKVYESTILEDSNIIFIFNQVLISTIALIFGVYIISIFKNNVIKKTST